MHTRSLASIAADAEVDALELDQGHPAIVAAPGFHRPATRRGVS
jgi:hypothetical protein